MLLLTATDESLELETAASPSTDYQVSWVDLVMGASPSLTPGSAQGNVAAVGTTTVAPAPAASTVRQVKSLTVCNRSESPNTVTVKKDVDGTDYHLLGEIELKAGETLAYEDGQGFRVFDAEGNAKVTNFVVEVPALAMAPHFATANLSSTKSMTSGSSFAVYVGKAPRCLAAAIVRWRVQVEAAGVVWAEVALAKGTVSVGGNPTLTVVGWADVAAAIAAPSPPVKTTAVNVATDQQLGAGDDLWIIIGHQVTATPAQVRAQSIADDLQVGVQGSASMRPSLNVGTGVAFTIESSSTTAPWLACLY